MGRFSGKFSGLKRFLKQGIKGYFINRAIKKIKRKYPNIGIWYNWVTNEYNLTYTRKGGAIFTASGSRREVIKEIKEELIRDLGVRI